MAYTPQITNPVIEPYGYTSLNGKALSNNSMYRLTFGVSITDMNYTQTVAITITNNQDSNVITRWVNAVSSTIAAPQTVEVIDNNKKNAGALTYTITAEYGDQKTTATVSTTVYEYKTPKLIANISRNDNEEMVLTFTEEHTTVIGDETNSLVEFNATCTTTENFIKRIYKTDLLTAVSPATLLGTYRLDKAYTFTLYIKDSITDRTITIGVPSERPVLDIGADGNTVKFFGTASESADKETLQIKDVAIFGDVSRIGKSIGPRIELNEDTVDIYFDTNIHGDVTVNDKSIHELIGGTVIHGYSSTAQSTGTDNSKATILKCFANYTKNTRGDFATPDDSGEMIWVNKTGIYNFQVRIAYSGATQYKRFEIAPYIDGMRQAPLASTFGADGGNRTLQQILNYTLEISAGSSVDIRVKPTEGISLNVTPVDITVTVLDYEGKYSI